VQQSIGDAARTGIATVQRQIIISNPLGLHARPAARIAQAAAAAMAKVWIENGDRTADATSILDLLALEGQPGARVTICIENPADKAILDEVAELIERGFDEDDHE
jgi:phosphotransferase system HPr (HPr) family protein